MNKILLLAALMNLSLYCNAMEIGDPVSAREHYNLGHQLFYGTQKDPSKAIDHWTAAANLGNADAHAELGKIHYSGKVGFEINYSKAFDHFMSHIQCSPNQSSVSHSVEYFLGNMYDQGLGVDPDKNEAIKYWTYASEKGHAGASDKLGLEWDLYDIDC